MKQIAIEVNCPLYCNKQTVYCYAPHENLIIPNGCESMCGDERCKECCQKSVQLAKEKLATDFSFHKR